MFSRYYRLLEISPNEGAEEIKRAYRKKAKLYHPDLNLPTSDREKFIEVTKAYEYLIERLNRPKHSRYVYTKKTYKQAQKQKARKARNPRDRAKSYSKMRYKSYRKESSAFSDEHNFWMYRLFYYGVQAFVNFLMFLIAIALLAGFVGSNFSLIVLMFLVLFGFIWFKTHKAFIAWKLDFKNVFSDQ